VGLGDLVSCTTGPCQLPRFTANWCIDDPLPTHADAAVPPWVGFNENEQMKAQMLELSAVK
jgi:hypothetical protein